MFTGGMTTRDRADAYARRIRETKTELEVLGWRKAREDEWRRASNKIRFAYSHGEWRIHTTFVGHNPQTHIIRVAPEPTRIPSVKEILFDIVDVNLVRGDL